MNNPKPLPRRHTKTPWIVHSKYQQFKLVEVVARPISNMSGEVFADDDLEQKLIDLDHAARCVNACELLSTDHPDREIESLQRDRARLMMILARQGIRPDPRPGVVLHPGSDVPTEHEKITESESPTVVDGRIQIGPLDC